MWKPKQGPGGPRLEPIDNAPVPPQQQGQYRLDPSQNNWTAANGMGPNKLSLQMNKVPNPGHYTPDLDPNQIQLDKVGRFGLNKRGAIKQEAIKKNLTDGKIDHIEHRDDCRPVSEMPVSKEDDLSYLELQKAERVVCAQEDLKSGTFIKITHEFMMKKLEEGQLEGTSMDPQADTFYSDMYQLVGDINGYLYKVFLGVQGLLFGVVLMHTMVLYLNNDLLSLVQFYSEWGLRLSQLIQIGLIVTTFGSLYLWMLAHDHYEKAGSISLQNEYSALRGKCILTFGCNALSYLFVIINHIYVSKISNNVSAIAKGDTSYNTGMGSFQGLNIAMTLFLAFSWIINLNMSKGIIEYSPHDVYIDSTIEEDEEL